jgi:hypothetical protein
MGVNAVSRVFCVPLVLSLALGCSSSEPEKRKAKKREQVKEENEGKTKEKEGRPPAFDRKDPVRTLHWIREISRDFRSVQDGGNQLASDQAKAKLGKKLGALKGKRVSWPIPVHYVHTDVTGLWGVGHPYSTEEFGLWGQNQQVPKDNFPCFFLGVRQGISTEEQPVGGPHSDVKTPKGKWVVKLRKGDLVQVSGTVNKVTWNQCWCAHSDRIWVFHFALTDIRLAPVE